jgi:hypothetical protein
MMTLEQELIASGVTLVTHDKIVTPEELKTNEMTYLIGGLIEYQEHGRFSPRLGDRIVFVQQSMAARGLSTGGRAPYGFGRALVGPNDEFVDWLEDGENVRRAGHHVRFLPHDEEKIAIWCMMLEWRAAGESCKRIAARLNGMGIPSPDAGRVRRDHGSTHRVPGKWHANTVRDLCANPIIAGIKEYGRRSAGRGNSKSTTSAQTDSRSYWRTRRRCGYEGPAVATPSSIWIDGGLCSRKRCRSASCVGRMA